MSLWLYGLLSAILAARFIMTPHKRSNTPSSGSLTAPLPFRKYVSGFSGLSTGTAHSENQNLGHANIGY